MKVIEQFTERRDGQWVTGRREVEMPGVITAEEAAKLPYSGRMLHEVVAELREQLLEHSLLGTEPDPALRAEYARLRAQLRTPT